MLLEAVSWQIPIIPNPELQPISMYSQQQLELKVTVFELAVLCPALRSTDSTGDSPSRPMKILLLMVEILHEPTYKTTRIPRVLVYKVQEDNVKMIRVEGPRYFPDIFRSLQVWAQEKMGI